MKIEQPFDSSGLKPRTRSGLILHFDFAQCPSMKCPEPVEGSSASVPTINSEVSALSKYQFIPGDVCLKCDVCCRFLEVTTPYAPFFLPEEAEKLAENFTKIGSKTDLKPLPVRMACGKSFKCRFFEEASNSCRVYATRPLDCMLYPFMVTYDKTRESVILALDTKCPYTKNKYDSPDLKTCAGHISEALEDTRLSGIIAKNRVFINDFQEDSIAVKKLQRISGAVFPGNLSLKRISLSDKGIFSGHLAGAPPASAFSFAQTYIWSNTLNILWKIIEGSLCVFAGDEDDFFLLFPPLAGTRLNKKALMEAFDALKAMNSGKSPAARIENIPEEFSNDIASLGFKTVKTDNEYIYKTAELAGLKGDKHKSHRALVNRFLKDHEYNYRLFTEDDLAGCLDLYLKWAGTKIKNTNDKLARYLAEDSYYAQKTAMMNSREIGLEGRLVEIDGRIRGYTFSFRLNKNTLAVLFETTDPDIKGLPQFMFKETAKEFASYEFINALGHSGMKNLKRTKEAYHPKKILEVLTAYKM